MNKINPMILLNNNNKPYQNQSKIKINFKKNVTNYYYYKDSQRIVNLDSNSYKTKKNRQRPTILKKIKIMAYYNLKLMKKKNL